MLKNFDYKLLLFLLCNLDKMCYLCLEILIFISTP